VVTLVLSLYSVANGDLCGCNHGCFYSGASDCARCCSHAIKRSGGDDSVFDQPETDQTRLSDISPIARPQFVCACHSACLEQISYAPCRLCCYQMKRPSYTNDIAPVNDFIDGDDNEVEPHYYDE